MIVTTRFTGEPPICHTYVDKQSSVCWFAYFAVSMSQCSAVTLPLNLWEKHSPKSKLITLSPLVRAAGTSHAWLEHKSDSNRTNARFEDWFVKETQYALLFLCSRSRGENSMDRHVYALCFPGLALRCRPGRVSHQSRLSFSAGKMTANQTCSTS